MVEVEAISGAPQLGETTRMALTASQEGSDGSGGTSNGGLSTVMAIVVAGSALLACVLGCGLLLCLVVRCRKRGRADLQPDARKGIAPTGALSNNDGAIAIMSPTTAVSYTHLTLPTKRIV